MPNATDLPTDFANPRTLHPTESFDVPEVPHPALLPRDNFSARAAQLLDAADYLLHRDDGWLRVIPPRDGAPCYAKWKFTHGKHAGCYCMVAVPEWAATSAIWELTKVVHDVDHGRRKPTVDKFFER